VLQFAYSDEAVGSWLGEAMATWAEHKYGAGDTSRIDFFKSFQNETIIPLTRKGGREYGAYVWLLWLAQRAGDDRAVFRLWSALGPAHSDDPQVVDPLVAKYLATLRLSWAQNFKDFAVEDLNRDLSRAVTPHLFSRGLFGDPALPLDVTPKWVRPPSTLAVGTRSTALGAEVEGRGTLNLLGAQYEHITAISGPVRAVEVTSHGLKPWGDLVVLAHTPSGWQRRDLQNDSVTFCRRTSGQDVDQLYLIADNHDDLEYHSGASYTITGKSNCSRRRTSRPART
jgi:hypothetical protein